jgi:hypothetical protein
LAEQPRTGFPLGRPANDVSDPEESAQPARATTAADGFPGMATARRAAAAPNPATAASAPIAVSAIPNVAPAARPSPPSTPATEASAARTRRISGDTVWERVRFEVTDAVTSGALSERLIRASSDVEAPITTGRRILVLGTAGGAGTTTVTALLSKLLGSIRQEPVMALDATDQGGNLLQCLGAAGPATLSALTHQFGNGPVRTLPEATTNAATCGNRVFAAGRPDVPALADAPISLGEWTDVSSVLSRFMAVTVVDGGGAPLSRHAAALAGTAHAVVFVSPPGEPEAHRLSSIREALAGTHPDVQQLGVVVRSRQDNDRSLTDGVVPFDRHIAGGGSLQLSKLGSRTRIAATELAGRALLAANRG